MCIADFLPQRGTHDLVCPAGAYSAAAATACDACAAGTYLSDAGTNRLYDVGS